MSAEQLTPGMSVSTRELYWLVTGSEWKSHSNWDNSLSPSISLSWGLGAGILSQFMVCTELDSYPELDFELVPGPVTAAFMEEPILEIPSKKAG